MKRGIVCGLPCARKTKRLISPNTMAKVSSKPSVHNIFQAQNSLFTGLWFGSLVTPKR